MVCYLAHHTIAPMSSSGSTYIPWSKCKATVPKGINVPICFCGSLCKFMKSEVLGDDYGMRFFMCENYEFDPPKRYGRDRLRYHLNRLCLCYAPFDFVMILIFAGQRLLRLFVILCSGSTPSSRSRLRTMLN